MARRSFVAGNWKMNKTIDESRALANDVRARLEGNNHADVALCPTYIALPAVIEAVKGSHIGVGAQNMHWEKSGAFTGELSGAMIASAGCQYVILGHSERRQFFGETDETVNKRLKSALANKLKVILCVGETKDERVNEVTEQIVRRQIEGGLKEIPVAEMANVTVAYEPVWAIGTGLTASPAQAQAVHAFIRELLRSKFGASIAESVRIQYGGSVKPDNAKDLLSQPDIDGALVGGASLVAADFEAIVKAAK
jgi:triosephosphate isomerase